MTALEAPARTRTLLCPVRIDCIGGWSDQALYRGNAAVLNAAVGWDGAYPLQLTGDGATSLVEGVGTGLGISSILNAGAYLQRRGDLSAPGWSEWALEYERENGTHGGWQDAYGGLTAGLKLIETSDGREFAITRNDAHPLFQHLVLFDTGTRRNSGVIGAKVRALLRGEGQFADSLSEIVRMAQQVFASSDPAWCVNACLAAWRVLCGYVPEMQEGLDRVPRLGGDGGPCVGAKYVGAGGGGYGLMFVREPDDRETVRAFLEGRGLWARAPELLDGARWE